MCQFMRDEAGWRRENFPPRDEITYWRSEVGPGESWLDRMDRKFPLRKDVEP
jgi:hypothetical protein